MLRVFLLIDCDGCREVFPYSRLASEDRIAWHVHSRSLIRSAEQDGWFESSDGNFHYCPTCFDTLEGLVS
jgi:hypothetical protein